MQNVIDKIEWMFAGLGGFLGWFFGGFDGFLYALVVFVVCDYFTGVLAAAIKHELSSAEGVHLCAGWHRQHHRHADPPERRGHPYRSGVLLSGK